MEGYHRIETELREDTENIKVSDSSLNFVLDVPWSRVQHLLQESDLVINSGSLSQSASMGDSSSGSDVCQGCHSKVRELEEKLADLQQQLSVAVSSNYTKNVMIEQLDKTLSKIVDGWKKLESEKIAQINNLEREKNAAKEELKREQEVIIKVERELTLTLDKLMLSQKEIQAIHNEKQTWTADFDSKISKLTNELTLAQTHNSNLIASNKRLVEDYENKLQEIKNKFTASIQEWGLHENKYKTEIKENHINLKGLQQENIQNKQTINTLQLQLQLLSNQLEDLLREKESLKVEVSILQARNAAEKTELEEREKVLVESIKKEQERKLTNLEKIIREQYDKKIIELEVRWQKSMEEKLQERINEDARERSMLEVEYEKAMQEQADRFNQQKRIKENELERHYRCKDESIEELMDQIKQLQQEKASLASGRSHLMSQIQGLLENQWQESLKILYGNPDTSQPTLKLSLTSLPSQNFLTQNLSTEQCEIPTTDCESVNRQRLHLCKTRIQRSQSHSQMPVALRRSNVPTSLLHENSRASLKGLHLKSRPQLPIGNQSKGSTLTLPPTNLFDDFDSFTKPFPQKIDAFDDVSIEYCLDQDHRINIDNEKYHINDLKRGSERCSSSFASRIDTAESVCSCKNDLPPKAVRKTQSLVERIPTPDEISKMTECSDSLQSLSDLERHYSKSQKQRFRSGADKSRSEISMRHEERQLQLKKYLEELLQRPPGEPFDPSKDMRPCKDENNYRVNKDNQTGNEKTQHLYPKH